MKINAGAKYKKDFNVLFQVGFCIILMHLFEWYSLYRQIIINLFRLLQDEWYLLVYVQSLVLSPRFLLFQYLHERSRFSQYSLQSEPFLRSTRPLYSLLHINFLDVLRSFSSFEFLYSLNLMREDLMLHSLKN